MTYRIQRDQSVQDSVREIALEQINEAIAEVRDGELDRLVTVHQVRKRCKKLRGLIRLVRPHFDEFQRENEWFRDAARDLAPLRDAQAMVLCFDALSEQFQDEVDRDLCDTICDELAHRLERIVDDKGFDEKLDGFLSKMRMAGDRAAWWQINQIGFPAVEDGLMRTYEHARSGLRDAYENSKADNFHAWRKQVKYHGYHTRLLRDICPNMLKIQRRVADELSEILGELHDLVVLRQTLLTDSDHFGGMLQLQPMIGLINRRCAELQAEAQPLGEWIFAEEPEHLAARFGRYWETWKSTGDYQPELEQTLTLVRA